MAFGVSKWKGSAKSFCSYNQRPNDHQWSEVQHLRAHSMIPEAIDLKSGQSGSNPSTYLLCNLGQVTHLPEPLFSHLWHGNNNTMELFLKLSEVKDQLSVFASCFYLSNLDLYFCKIQ